MSGVNRRCADLQPAGEGGVDRRHAAADIDDHVICRHDRLLQVDIAGPNTFDDGEGRQTPAPVLRGRPCC